MKQSESVFNAVVSVLGTDEFNGAVSLTPEQRKEVTHMVAQSIADGETDMTDKARAKYDSFEAILSGYAPGLVSNWLRKDLRLNGGTPYKAKNPGSRSGSQDPVIKELKKLRDIVEGEDELATINAQIAQRQAEIKAEKAKKVEINTDILPEEVRSMVPQAS